MERRGSRKVQRALMSDVRRHDEEQCTTVRNPRAGYVGMVVVVNAGLFIGSLVFLATGQSFEQFRGIE